MSDSTPLQPIEPQWLDPCPECLAAHRPMGVSSWKCPTCHGRGSVLHDLEICPKCNGQGTPPPATGEGYCADCDKCVTIPHECPTGEADIASVVTTDLPPVIPIWEEASSADEPEGADPLSERIQALLDSHTFEDETAFSRPLQEDLYVKILTLIREEALRVIGEDEPVMERHAGFNVDWRVGRNALRAEQRTRLAK